MFGSSNTGSGLFGGNQQNKSIFGSSSTTTSPFGGGAQSTSLFGSSSSAQATQSGGLFGAKPAFGSTSTTGGGLFGKPAASSPFGSTQQNTSSGLFGGGTATNTSFGGNTSGSGGLFGSQSSSGGLFGKTTGTTFGTAVSAPNGTGSIKFNPPINPDTMMKNGLSSSIQTKNFCITAMKEYEGKSFEELRVDDYIANRKTPQAGTSGGGLFGGGSTTTTGGLFGGGTQPKPIFGSTTTTSSPFGGGASQGTSLFGSANNNQQQQSGGLFGSKPATGNSLFGSSTTTTGTTFGSSTTSGGLFGKPAASSPFGNTQQNTSGTLSSSTQSTKPSTGGLFGGGATSTTSTFGTATNTTGGGLFGSTPANTGGSLFGKPATTTGFGGFGSTGTTGATTGGGLFGGSPAAKQGGLFGSTTTTGSGLFGNTGTQQTGGLFGSTQPAQQTGGLFGSTTQPAAGNVVVTNPATVAVAAQPIILGSDVNETMLKMAMIEANLATNPYGDSPLLKLAGPMDSEDKPNPISAQRQMRFLKKAAETGTPTSVNGSSGLVVKSNFLTMNVPVAGSKIRSRSIAVSGDLNYKSTRTPPTLGKGIGGKAAGSNNSTFNSSFNNSFANKSIDPHIDRALSNNSNILPGSAKKGNIKYLDLDEIKSAMKNSNKSIIRSSRDADELPIATVDDTENIVNNSVITDPREVALRREIQRQPPVPIDLNITSESAYAVSPIISSSSPQHVEAVLSVAGVTLKTSDYYCEPSIRAMSTMVENGEVVLPNGFTIGRATYGNIYWPGPITLKDVALDEIVIFRHKEVTVYPNDTTKPPLGEGLNRPAEVTLERVWHVNRETMEEIKDPIVLADMGWRDRLERATLKMGAIFKDYRPATGSWVFKVEHFSKYGLADDEDEGEVIPKKPIDPRQKERELQSLVQRTNIANENFTMEYDEVPEEIEMEDVLFVNGVRSVPSGLTVLRGLGGELDAACDMELGYEEDADDLVIPPEKKIKIDIDEDQKLLESNITLGLRYQPALRFQREAVMNSTPAVRQFEGGYPIKKCKGFGISKSSDLCSARGTVCRVGWSAKGHFVKSLQPESNGIIIQSVDRACDIQKDYVSDMLEHNIRLSQTIQRNHSISAKVRHHELDGQQVAPRIKPSNDPAQLIDSFCATANQSSRIDEERVWKLTKTLFPGNDDGRWRWERLENISNWLREEVAALPKVNFKGRGSAVWEAICRGDLEEGVKAATEEDLPHVCTMLASFQVDPRATQQDFQAQIDYWKTFNMLNHLDIHVLKIYLLMSGTLSISFKDKTGNTARVSCIDGLPWKQTMGIYLWYLRGFRCFEETLDEAVQKIAPPKEADDVLFYHLLRLSRDQAYSVEVLLDAAINYSSGPFDYHLSWHLWTVLRSIGFNTMDAAAEQQLHTGYAEQLMANEAPDLALFVLSHISNDQVRSAKMKECLDRFAMTSTKTDYIRITEILNIPRAWIAAAKYIKAKATNQMSVACETALDAGEYAQAFNILVKEVAPSAVVSDDLEELERLIGLFESVSDRIPSWGLQGQLYSDYVEFKRISRGDSDDDDDLKVAELISNISAKLTAPIFETPIQRLCSQNIGLEMFEAQRLLTGTLAFDIPLNMADLAREISAAVQTTTTR